MMHASESTCSNAFVVFSKATSGIDANSRIVRECRKGQRQLGGGAGLPQWLAASHSQLGLDSSQCLNTRDLGSDLWPTCPTDRR